MKPSRRKGLAGMAALLWAMAAQAYVWIIITLVIIAVGTVIVVKLLQCIKHLWPNDPPPPGQPTNVLRVIESNQFIYDNSSAGPAPNVELLQVNATNGFVFQYCMDEQVWAVAGTGFDDTVSPTLNTSSNYVFSISAGGQRIQFTSDTNSITGYDTVVLDDDTTTWHPVIERSTGLGGWLPIFTNAGCMKYDVQTFTDTNPPPGRAFYRINWQ